MSVQFKHNFNNAECFSIDFSKDESRPYFASGFSDGTLRLWNLNDLTKNQSTLDKPCFEEPDAIQMAPVDVKFNAQGTKLVATSVDNSIKAYNVREDSSSASLSLLNQSDQFQAWKTQFNPATNDQIITGQLNLYSINVDTMQTVHDYTQAQKNTKYIHSIAYAPDGKHFATGNLDGVVQVFDTNKHNLKTEFGYHGKACRAIQFCHNGASLVSAGEDAHIYVADIETTQRRSTLVGHGNWITDIAVHPKNQNIFVTTSLDKTVKIWSLQQNKSVKSIDLGEPLWSVSFSPTGDYFVTASEDGTITLVNFDQSF